MTITPASFVTQYSAIRDEVKNLSSSQWAEIVMLCKRVPKTIDIDAIWQFGKDKPCWSNIKVAGGARIESDLHLSADFNSYKSIASASWDIQKVANGKASSSFRLIGLDVDTFVKSLTSGGLKSYLWRLYAIREFALALNDPLSKVHPHINKLISKGFLDAHELKPWSKHFAKNVGYGWGYITANHMLTDLGVSIKPDLHVRRSGIRLGLVDGISTDLSNDEIDDLSDDVDHAIVKAVVDLAQYVDPIAFPGQVGAHKRKIALREMDKVLMEWSRMDLSRGDSHALAANSINTASISANHQRLNTADLVIGQGELSDLSGDWNVIPSDKGDVCKPNLFVVVKQEGNWSLGDILGAALSHVRDQCRGTKKILIYIKISQSEWAELWTRWGKYYETLSQDTGVEVELRFAG